MLRLTSGIPIALILAAAPGAYATTAIAGIDATATQAIVRVATNQAGACTYRASENGGLFPLVHDVDTGLFAGSNVDSRAGSMVAGSYHTFVLGRRTSEQAADGLLYSRALHANTTHWIGVTCGQDSEVVRTFQTQDPPLGQTVPESAPFNAAGFGNYAWPSIDFADPSKTYIDPMTGLALKRITSPDWANTKDDENNAFATPVDLNSRWTNAANLAKWPGAANTLATYSGNASDPIFAPIDPSTVQDYQFGALSIAGWTPQVVMDDLRVLTFGFGSDAAAANRTVLACLSLDSGATCNTPEISIVLPSGSAQTGPTAPASGYPKAGWTSWASTLPFTGRDFGTVITTVTTSGHTITNAGSQSSQYFARGWKAGGKVLVNGTETYTIAAVVNSATLTTVEAVVTHASAVSFKSLVAGVRIRKQTAVGSISLSAGYDFAVSGEFTMPFTGVRNLCSSQKVTVTNDANGNPAPARQASICAMQSNFTHALFAFFEDNGETRFLSQFTSAVGFQYHAPDWTQFDGASIDNTRYTGSDVWDPAVPTRFYTSIHYSGGHYSLLRVDYTGNFTSYKPWPETNGYYRTGFFPDDHLTFTVVGGYPSQGLGVDQQTAAFGNPLFDPSIWNVWTFAGLLPGGVATWSVGPSCCGENPSFLVLQDISSGRVTKVIDTISTYPMRFWGTHTTQILGGNFVIVANIPGNKGTDINNYLGGPFMLVPTAVQQNGVWNSNTALTATYADVCPVNVDSRWASQATGQNCVKIRAKQPCSSFASTAEAAKFPCPWDSTKSMVSTVAPGDRFWPGFPVAPGGETMRIVTQPVDIGGGSVEFWVLRHSENFNNIGGSYGGTGDAHANGWTAGMIPPEARTNATVYVAPDGTIFPELYGFSSTHGALGVGIGAGSSTAIIQGVDPGTHAVVGNAYGIRWNTPITQQAGQLPDYNFFFDGFFGQKDLGGGAIETYMSMQQNTAPPGEKKWFMDLHHLNPSTGTGQEVYAGVGNISATLVAGTAHVFRFTVYPGDHSDIKRFPAMAYAGPYLLLDVSGPSSRISDANSWAFCFVYKSGECIAGSVAGEVYASVSGADTRGTTDGVCIAGWYAQVNPCAMIPYASAGWAIQVDASRPAVGDNYYRKLTQGFSGMGRQYQFGNVTAAPDGQWSFMQCYWCGGFRNEILGIQMPSFPIYDSVNRADFIPYKVQVPGGAGVRARIRFGYAENGPPSSFFCTSRQEACVTDTLVSPFAYAQTEASAGAAAGVACANGCAVNVPALSGRILYYAIERLDTGGNVIETEAAMAAPIP